MKYTLLTIMLLGLLTSASFAQRGRAPQGAARTTTQVGPALHSGANSAVSQSSATAPRSEITVGTRPDMKTTGATGKIGGVIPPQIAPPPEAPPFLVVGPDVGVDHLQR